MQLEDYFDFFAPDDIRIKGHRIGIESILYEYIHNAMPPEEMVERFPSLNLEQIYAAILYYLQNKERIDQYLTDWLDRTERMHREQAQRPTPTMLKLRRLKAEKEAKKLAELEAT